MNTNVADLGQIRCSQSWEDPETLRGALAPSVDSRILSIAAAGDNSFALLLQGAGRVVSIDASPAQCALVELKRAAIRTLDHDELLRFVGVAPANDRRHVYSRVRVELPDDARMFWDAQPELLGAGIIHIGKLEHMWQLFHGRALPLIHGRRTVRAAFDARTSLARERFWHERWNNRRWRLALRLFASERANARLWADRAWNAFVELDPSTNPFLQYSMLGRFLDLPTGHPWLAPDNHELLRSRLDDLDVVCSELETFLHACEQSTFTGFNLGDVFEWMSDEEHEQAYRSIVDAAAPGAKLAYWSNLVARSAPASLLENGVVSTDPALARRLHDADRSFLYRDFFVDTVLGPGGSA